MSDDDTVINFRKAAERMATARKPNPDLEERKRKAAEATAQRLDDADRVANAMKTKLSVEDRRILVTNLGAIVVSVFGSEIAAKRNMVDVFKTAFGRDWESQYKKRGRFVRFPSEGDPGDCAGATYAQGWAYLDLARAISRLDPRTDPADDRAESRMILRMIEGTSCDSTVVARGRHTSKLEAAFADRLRTLIRSLDPKLGRMLGAGLEAGRTVEDLSTDLEGMEAQEFWLRERPSVEIGSITQKLPVVLAVPLGITVQEMARRFAEWSSDAEARLSFLQKNKGWAYFRDKAEGNELAESFALAVFGSSDFALQIAAEALGIAKPTDADPNDLRWLLDAVGQARLEWLFKLSNRRFDLNRNDQPWGDLSGAEILDYFVKETGAVDAATVLRSLPRANEEVSPSAGEIETLNQVDFKTNVNALVEFVAKYKEAVEYNYKHLFEHSSMHMDFERPLTLSPVLDKATNDWRLMLALPEMDESKCSSSAAAVKVVKSLGLSATEFPIVFAFLLKGEIARVKLDDLDEVDRVAIGRTWDKESGQVFLTFYHTYEDELEVPDPLRCPVLGLRTDWTTVLSSRAGLSFCLSPIPQPETPMHGRLELTLSKGTADHRFAYNSLAAAISADLFEGEGAEESKIVSELKQAIAARTDDFVREAREKLEKYERGLRHLRVPDL